jgi:hypothetical protein
MAKFYKANFTINTPLTEANLSKIFSAGVTEGNFYLDPDFFINRSPNNKYIFSPNEASTFLMKQILNGNSNLNNFPPTIGIKNSDCEMLFCIYSSSLEHNYLDVTLRGYSYPWIQKFYEEINLIDIQRHVRLLLKMFKNYPITSFTFDYNYKNISLSDDLFPRAIHLGFHKAPDDTFSNNDAINLIKNLLLLKCEFSLTSEFNSEVNIAQLQNRLYDVFKNGEKLTLFIQLNNYYTKILFYPNRIAIIPLNPSKKLGLDHNVDIDLAYYILLALQLCSNLPLYAFKTTFNLENKK